jgi:DNA-binding HxlR family transcriptional regulator
MHGGGEAVVTGTELPSAVGQALLALGDQWTLLILQRAFVKHLRRFAGWRDELGMSESVLASRLKEMVSGDLLRLSEYRDGRIRHEYRLTVRAMELWSLLVAIWSWERTWVARPEPLPDLIHPVCGARTDVVLGCGACDTAFVTARDTETCRGEQATFGQVAVARYHRRTVRDRMPDDPLSYLPQTMEILGDRWSTVVLAAAFLGVRRFADFQAELGIAPSVLSDRLRRFVDLGVLAQADAPGGRQHYRLTDKGLAFFPVFAFLVAWAQQWYHGPTGTDLTIRHAFCGKQLLPVLRCTACGRPVERTAVYFDLPPFPKSLADGGVPAPVTVREVRLTSPA